MASLIVLNLPRGALFGIDGHTWKTGEYFCGFQDVPEGLHWAYYTISVCEAQKGQYGFCQGFFFRIEAADRVIWQYNSNREMLQREITETRLETVVQERLIVFPVEKNREHRVGKEAHILGSEAYISEFGCRVGDRALGADIEEKEAFGGEVCTEGKRSIFGQLMCWITCSMLDKVLSVPWEVTSATSSYLDEALPGLPVIEAEGTMELLGIELRRTWRPGAVGQEVTEGFLDKSWELERIIETECLGGAGGLECFFGLNWVDIGRFLGEFQMCFIVFIFVSNGSCLEQWKRMITLISSCSRAIGSFSSFYVHWMDAFRIQLQYCPEDVFVDVFQDRGYIKKSLKRLECNILNAEASVGSLDAVKRAFMCLLDTLKQRFHIDLNIQKGTYLHSTSLVYDSENDELVDMSDNDSYDNGDSDDDPIVVQL
ncbi:unnamed protein product [Pneumocystis jirovecii]|uniref:A1 cistron-splicing factor AAR2 n=1 Tax=Pneumocystis jirovecii TaxID=42068 RepID=L0PG56_PNEJI|nr:unnamed protein product [Pneumocystis jirovecii]